ncbi:MAG: hypothetical protein HY726_08075 [Candidatus Rokubacteria bacterium]|nr:hypothetical protein [Candidatus Rokubacteria bacterium]
MRRVAEARALEEKAEGDAEEEAGPLFSAERGAHRQALLTTHAVASPPARNARVNADAPGVSTALPDSATLLVQPWAIRLASPTTAGSYPPEHQRSVFGFQCGAR